MHSAGFPFKNEPASLVSITHSRRPDPGILLLLSFLLLTWGMAQMRGVLMVISLCASFGLLFWAILILRKHNAVQFSLNILLSALFLLIVIDFGWGKTPIDLRSSWHVLGLVTVIGYAIASKVQKRAATLVFFTSVLISIGFRIAVPIISPSPDIDVFIGSTEAANHMLQGLNPYSTPLENIGEHHNIFGYQLNAYFYLPLPLLLQTLSLVMTSDIRYASVLAEIVIIIGLYILSRTHLNNSKAELLTLLFALHPYSLFVIELAWLEPMILALVWSAFIFYVFNKKTGSAAFLGLASGMKQSLMGFIIAWPLLRMSWKHALITIIFLTLPMILFFIWDPISLWREGILFQFRSGFRADSMNILGFLHTSTNVMPGKGFGAIVGIVAALMSTLLCRPLPPAIGFVASISLSSFALFLFGPQAFLNYYYLVMGLTLLLMSVSGSKKPENAF